MNDDRPSNGSAQSAPPRATLAAIAATADLNWRWKRTLIAVASCADRGRRAGPHSIRIESGWSDETVREHIRALDALEYVITGTSENGLPFVRINRDRFAELERNARTLGRL